MKTRDFLSGGPLSRCFRVIAFVVLVYCCCWMIIGDFPHNVLSRAIQRKYLLKDVLEHQELWESTGITHYRVSIRNQGYTSYWLMCNSATVEVRDRIVVGIAGQGENTQWCQQVYRDLTVRGLFNLAREYIDRNDAIRVRIDSIEYNEELGFIDHLSISVFPTLVDPYLYGDEYLSIVEPEYFDVWLTDFQPLD